MAKINVKNSFKVNAPANKAWEIVGPNFVNISTWARGIQKSWENTETKKNFNEAPTGG